MNLFKICLFQLIMHDKEWSFQPAMTDNHLMSCPSQVVNSQSSTSENVNGRNSPNQSGDVWCMKKRGTSGWETVCDLIKLTDWFWGWRSDWTSPWFFSRIVIDCDAGQCSLQMFWSQVRFCTSVYCPFMAGQCYWILHGLVLSRVKTCIRFDGSFFLGQWK